MNTFVKIAVAGALSLAATGAFANISAPWTNSSDLVLVVENASTHAAYALDLGVTIDQLLPTGSLVSNSVMSTAIQTGINQTIAASPLLQSFLSSNPAAGDDWTLEGGQYNGGGASASTAGNTRPVAGAKAVFTSSLANNNNGVLAGKIASNLIAIENGLQADINAPNGGAQGIKGLETATETTAADVAVPSTTRYGVLGADDYAALGNSTVQLFGFTGNGGSGTLQSYILGTASLATNGTLTFSTGVVPLPAAVWLFGSGLLGFFGVSRRRSVAAV